MTPHTAQYFFGAPRKPQHVSRAHVTHAVTTRTSLCPRLVDGGCNMLVHCGHAKHRVPVREPQHIPREHTGRTLLILVRVISMEERIFEPLRFGAPARTFQRCTHLRALPSAPVNARCDVFVRIGHGAPPLLERTSAKVRPVSL